jgi:hypothetical protein
MVFTDKISNPDADRSDTNDSSGGYSADDGGSDVSDAGRRWWPLILVTVAVLVGISLLFPAGRHQWKLSFVRQPAHFTTLSFVDADNLPTTSIAGGPLHLSFRVKNQEGQIIRYAYLVTSGNDSSPYIGTVLHQGSLRVPAGGQRTVSINVVPKCSGTLCRVQVALPGYSESVDFVVHVDRFAG